MNGRNEGDVPRSKLQKIELDLATYKVLLHFQDQEEPLLLHFDTPSRRFYFSLIALVVTEMKNRNKTEFIHIRKHEKILRLLDNSLAGQHASKTVDGMWGKINQAWHHRLPDLEKAAHFKVLERELIPPHEKGGKYRYECSDEECDTWASLFAYDETNKWRFKFAIDLVSLSLSDISMILGGLRDNSAWQEFVKRLSMQPKAVDREKRAAPRRWKKAAFSLTAILIVGAVTWAIWNSYIPPVPPTSQLELPGKPSIAVLPFNNLSGDPEQEYFSDGLTDEIITILSKVPKLFVIARNSTFTYKGKPVKVQQVSKELGVRYVLEGSVRKGGDRIRITVQLIDALSGKHLWAEQYDRNLDEIFAVQDEITKEIITAMQVKLTEGEQARAAARGTNNLEAYLKCLQANEYSHRVNPESVALAMQLAEEAIALDPEYAWAYYNLARAHIVAVWVRASKSPKESLVKAMELLQKAIALDNTPAEAHGRLGFLYSMTRQYDEGVAEAEKAVALNPNSSMAHVMLGKTLSFAGKWEESISPYKKAIRLNPIPPNMYLYSLGLSYAFTGQYEEGITWCEKAVRQAPDSLYARIMLTVVYSWSGQDEKARAEAAEVLRIQPKFIINKNSRYKRKADGERFNDALRKAGLKCCEENKI
ncbi:MAG: tetratricopeptide repeat protein [Syntrophobacteria bacterium]